MRFQNSKKRFPYADMSRFKVQVDFDPKRKATGEVLFQERRFKGGPTLRRPQILVTSYERRFGNASRRRFSLSVIAH